MFVRACYFLSSIPRRTVYRYKLAEAYGRKRFEKGALAKAPLLADYINELWAKGTATPSSLSRDINAMLPDPKWRGTDAVSRSVERCFNDTSDLDIPEFEAFSDERCSPNSHSLFVPLRRESKLGS